MTVNMKVFDVPQYNHFDDDEYPECSSYFMYGNKKDAFLFHIPTKNPDFLQASILLHKGLSENPTKELDFPLRLFPNQSNSGPVED